MHLRFDPTKTHAAFDEPNLVSRAGLVPLMALARRCGLHELAGQHVRISAKTGVFPEIKIPAIIAGMAAGADSIDDLDVLRHGAMPDVFAGIRAPSTLGSFLRSFSHGNVAQLQKVSRLLLAELARHTPLLAGAGEMAHLDLDSAQERVFGYHKQGAAYGHAKIAGKSVAVKGLNVLAASITTPLAAPVAAGTQLRGGNANTARGAAWFATRALETARQAGCTGILITRMDSGYYTADAVCAARTAGAYFSVTARMDAKVKAAIAAIPGDAWTPIQYPHAIYDELAGGWVSDAEVAEVPYTAFTSRAKDGKTVTARLIVRRVRRLGDAPAGQGELFALWRYHPVFTDSPFAMTEAEADHRDRGGAIEQLFADLNNGPLAHMPSGVFNANAAWLALAAICHNLMRAAGCLASAFFAMARGTTIRARLINVAARIARHGRGHITLHLPQDWPWEQDWLDLFAASP
ncbi:MAG: IS1380 family transposase [Streptosporangiaceae bacterium]